MSLPEPTAPSTSQSTLSEYERERLENIRRNQEILASFNVSSLKLADQISKKVSAAPKKRQPRPSEAVSTAKTHRMSTRSSANRKNNSKDLDSFQVEEDEPPKKPSWQDLKDQRTSLDIQTFRLEGINVVEAADEAPSEDEKEAKASNMKNVCYREEGGLKKVLRSRIYSMAWHPNVLNDKFVCFVGDKDGNLAVVDLKESRAAGDFSDSSRGVSQLRPSKETISSLKFSPTDPNKMYMSCYDGTIRTMDLASETISVAHHLPSEFITGFDFAENGTLFYATGSGSMGILDERQQRAAPADVYAVHDKKTQCISVNWTHPNVFCTSSLDNTVCLWDMRSMFQHKAPAPFKRYEHRRSVTSAFFHRFHGDKLVTTCYDDFLRYYSDAVSSPETQPHTAIHHNNQTGKWITTFKATWDNCASSASPYFIIGDMAKSASVFDGDSCRLLQRLDCEFLTAQPAVNAVHPKVPTLICSGTASGKIAVWS